MERELASGEQFAEPAETKYRRRASLYDLQLLSLTTQPTADNAFFQKSSGEGELRKCNA